MAAESEQQAQRDVTATTDSYGGPVSDEELAEVYLPEGQDEVKDTGAGGSDSAQGKEPAPDGTGTLQGSAGAPSIEPPD